MDSLLVALPTFLICATLVIISGIGLARFGDELARITRWGHLWVGMFVVAIGTSLPEVITSIAAVWLGSPELALGNLFGANMANMFLLALVVLIFGGANVLRNHDNQALTLAALALFLGVLALIMALDKVSFAFGVFSLSGLLLGCVYLIGVTLIYNLIPDDTPEEPNTSKSGHDSRPRLGLSLLVCIATIGITAPLLAISAESLALATGLSKSFMGLLALSLVTTLPEGVVTVAAIRRGAYGLAAGNLYGSCAFNIAIISIIDPVNGTRPILSNMAVEHFAAGSTAILLMSLSILAMTFSKQHSTTGFKAVLLAIAAIYPAGLYWCFTLAQ